MYLPKVLTFEMFCRLLKKRTAKDAKIKALLLFLSLFNNFSSRPLVPKGSLRERLSFIQ